MQYNVNLKIKREGTWVDKSEFVQLPITIKETLDDTMDTAEVILGLTNDSKEYEAWDEVDMSVSIDGSFRNYYFVIQRDRVEERRLGLSSKWDHKLTLIEATQKLSTLQTNDFAITQPLEVAISPVLSLRDDITNIVSTNNIHSGWEPLESEGFPNYSEWQANGVITTGIKDATQFFFLDRYRISAGAYEFTINRPSLIVKQEYDFDSETSVLFPPLPTGKFRVGIGVARRAGGTWVFPFTQSVQLDLSFHDRLVDTTTNTDITNLINRNTNRISMENLVNGHTYRYYVATGSNSSSNARFWDNPLNSSKLNQKVFSNYEVFGNLGTDLLFTIENDTVQNVLQSPTSISVDFTFVSGIGPDGPLSSVTNATNIRPYEYYHEFKVEDGVITEGYFVDDSIIKAVESTVVRRLEDYKYFFQVDVGEFFDTIESDDVNGRLIVEVPYPTDFYAYIGNGARNFGYKFGIIFVEKTGSETIRVRHYINKSLLEEGFVNVGPEIDKSFPSVTFTSKKIDLDIDGEILQYVSNIQSPEFTFAGGKNLLEVLFEIGKTFNGIPRLKLIDGRDVISFDILSKKIKDNPGFDHGNNVLIKESDADNYATGLVSIVENAINDDIVLVSSAFYPSKDGWAKVKSKNPNDSILNLSKMALVIENENSGIHRIVNVKVRNFNSANPSQEADISELVVDKNLYNTLEPNVNVRGRYLYYEQGKNFIDGLSYLPDKDEIAGALGTKYAIQLALESIGFNTGFNIVNGISKQIPVSEYEFRIEYVPVFKNLRLFSEQSKVLTEKKRVFNAFSQPERNTSLLQHGENADVILKRTGVNSVSSTYLITSPVELPFIGEELQLDGFTYYADNITFVYDNLYISTNVSYTRDINKLDKFVGYNRNYREYELYTDNYVWKQKNINKYCYITTEPGSPKEFSGTVEFKNSFKSLFSGTNFPAKLDTAVLQFFDINGKKPKYEFQNTTYSIPNIVLNSLSGYTNNSLFFVSSMQDNYSAGNTIERIPYNKNANGFNFGAELDGFLDKPSIQQVRILRALEQQLVVADDDGDDFEDNRRRLNAVPYVDSFGNADVMRISYFASGTLAIDENFPKFKSDLEIRNIIPNAKMSETIYLDKDNREAIQQTMQIHFISKAQDITILSPFLKYNRLIANPNFNDVQTMLDYTGRLIIVGIADKRKAIDEKRVDYQNDDILQTNISLIDAVDSYTSLIANYGWQSPKNYEAYGLVYANTKELAMVFERPLVQGQFHQMPLTYIGLSDNPI